jgi:hypothetical protein
MLFWLAAEMFWDAAVGNTSDSVNAAMVLLQLLQEGAGAADTDADIDAAARAAIIVVDRMAAINARG